MMFSASIVCRIRAEETNSFFQKHAESVQTIRQEVHITTDRYEVWLGSAFPSKDACVAVAQAAQDFPA